MNILDRINFFIQLFLDALRQLFSGRIWAPLVLYAALQWLVLYAHYQFNDPNLFGVMSFWTDFVRADYATAFTHYPQHFVLLGYYYGWAKMLIGLPLEGLILGLVARRFYFRYTGEWPQNRLSFGTWINLILIWVVMTALLTAAGQFLPTALSSLIDSPRRMLAFAFVVVPALYSFIVALFYLAIPMLAIGRMNFLTAISRSLKGFIRRPIMFFSLAGVSLAGPLLVGALTSQPSKIVDGFKPELVYWLIAASLVLEAIAYFFWMGTAVRYLDRTGE